MLAHRGSLTPWITAAVRGDAAAIAALVEALAPRVRVMVGARLLAPFECCEDVAQEALMAFAGSVTNLRETTEQGLLGFVSSIVRNAVVDEIRRRGADPLQHRAEDRRASSHAATGARLIDAIAGSSRTPSSAAALRESSTLVMEELHAMRPRERDILLLAFCDGLNTTEIGKALGLQRTTAAMALARAIDELRHRWAWRNGRA